MMGKGGKWEHSGVQVSNPPQLESQKQFQDIIHFLKAHILIFSEANKKEEKPWSLGSGTVG